MINNIVLKKITQILSMFKSREKDSKSLNNKDLNYIHSSLQEIEDLILKENLFTIKRNTLLELLVRNIPGGCLLTDQDFNIQITNYEASGITGYNAKEMEETNLKIMFADQSGENLLKLIKKNKGNVQNHDATLKKKNKESIPVIINTKRTTLDNESFFLINFQDISKQKNIENKLNESKERYRLLFESANSAIFIMEDEKFIECNSKTLEIFKCKKEDILNKNPQDFSPEKQPNGDNSEQKAREYINKALNGEPQFFEWKHIRSDNTPFDAEVSLNRLVISDKEYVQAIVNDITKRKKAERELIKAKEKAEKNESKSSSLLSAIPDLMFVFKNDGTILDYHAEDRSKLYSSPELFLNKRIDDILPKNLAVLTHRYINKVLKTKETEEYEYDIEVEGKKYTYDARLVYMEKDKVLSIARDITHSKKAEKELIKAKEKAEESDRLKSEFLANMSHEIRTPMNGILGFTQLLKEQELTGEKKQEFLKVIEKRSRHLLQIINDIIDISKIEANQLALDEKPVRVNELLEELIKTSSIDLKKRNKDNINLKLSCDLTPTELIIQIDEIRLRQILTNLLNNAIKFTREGEIVLGCELRSEDTLLFFVKDTGCGIPENNIETIFDRFRQAVKFQSHPVEGTGIGLSISKHLVEMMGGEIWVESKEGQGSKFSFTVPYKIIKSFEEKKQQPKIKTEFNWEGRTILLVEDDPVSQILIQELLKRSGVNIVTKSSGKEIAQWIKKNPDVSLILMDIQLPASNGLDIVKEIRTFNKDVPIIAQTAYAMGEDKEKAINAGCNDFLTKPLNEELFFEILSQFL